LKEFIIRIKEGIYRMKYFEIGKITWKRMSTYKFDVCCEVVFAFARILLAYVMWRAIYKYNIEVAGYSFSMMITYFIIISLIKNLEQSEGLSKEMAEEIRNGEFTKYLVRPVNFLGYFYASSLFRTLFTTVTSIVGFVVGYFILHKYFVLPYNIASLLIAVVIFLLALNCMLFIDYCIMVISFYLLQISSFYLVKYNIFEFITGSFVPLVMFPEKVQAVFKLFPFYYLYQYPISVYFGEISTGLEKAFLILGIWNVVLLIFSLVLYKFAVKRYEGVAI